MKNMKMKESWKLLLIALSISNYAYAETEITSPIIIQDEEQYTISEDTKITISNSVKNDSAILVQSGGSLKSMNGAVIEIDMTSGEGDGIRIDSKSESSSFDLGETHIKSNQNGIYTLSDPTGAHTIQMKLGDHSSIESGATALKIDGNSMIEIGTDAKIQGASYGPTVASVSASNGGKIIIGDRAEISNSGTVTNQNGIAVMAQNTATAPSQGASVTIGNQSRIYTLGTDIGNHAVKAGNVQYYKASGNITIGDSADISTVGSESYALYSVNAGAKIKVGTDAYIHTSGKNSSAVRVGTANKYEKENAGDLIEVGDRARIETKGQGSHGLDARYDGSVIRMGKDMTILTTGKDAYGVYAEQGGQIELKGGEVSSAKSYALYVTGRDSTSQKRALIQGDGIFTIDGDLYADDYGMIDLSLRNGSNMIAKAGKSSLGTLDLAMEAGSQWQMDGDSQVNRLNLSGGSVFFTTDTSGGSFGTLTVENLSGSQGTFYMRTDIVGDGLGINTGDKLIVTNTSSGNHSVYVTNSGSADTTGDEKLTIIETADGETSGVGFGLTNVVELGGYQYRLRQDPDQMGNWELYGTKGDPTDPDPGDPSNPADAGVSLFSGAYLLNYAEMNTLMQRMGDLRQEGHDKGNIWVRTFGGKMKTKGDHFLRGNEMDYWGLQVGVDKKISIKKGSLYVGGMFGYTKGNMDYSYGSGSIDSKYLGVYGTYMAPNGFYSDLVLKYGWMKDDFNVYDSAGALVKGDNVKTNGFTASLEVGKQYYFNQKNKEGWYIEPQGQISFSRQDGDSFTASNGLRIHVDSYNSILGRLGTNVGYQLKGGKNPINAYAKVSFVHEFDGDVDYQLNRSKESTSYGDSWWTYGLGIAAKVGERHHVYLDLERASGGNFTQEWNVNGGYRYSW